MTHRHRLLIGTLALAGGLVVLGSAWSEALAQEAPKPAPAPSTPQAQPTPEPRRGAQPGDIQRVFTLHYLRVRDMAGLLKAFPAEISYSTYSDEELHALAVSAKPAVMAVIEETIKRLDVPPPPQSDIEIAADVLRAQTAPGKPDNLPERLRPVVAQLRALFDYSGYKVQDTLVGRAARGGRVEMASIDPAQTQADGAVTSYELKVGRATARGQGKDAVVELERVEFKGAFPIRVVLPPGTVGGSNFSYKTTQMKADVSLHSGQYVVIGKTGTGEDGVVVILVLTARVVD